MVWGKAGSTTLTSAGDDVDITSLAEGTNRMIMSHMINSGACQNKVTFNDTGSSKYASRNEYNDDADSTQVNQNFVPHWDGNDNASNDQFVVSFLSDIDGEEKLGLYWGIDRGTAGTNTIRSRNMVYKYINTPKITRLPQSAFTVSVVVNENASSVSTVCGVNQYLLAFTLSTNKELSCTLSNAGMAGAGVMSEPNTERFEPIS